MSELEQVKEYLRSLIDALATLEDNEVAKYRRDGLEATLEWIETVIEIKGIDDGS